MTEYRFILTYSGTDTTVDEPKDWVNFESELNRDFNSHGAVFQYTSGTIKLGFVGSGRDLLEAAFQNDGFDAVVTLTVDKRTDQYFAWENIFIGDAIFENREYTQDYFMIDFEDSGFKQKLKNRLNTKVKLDTTVDLDGNTLTGSLTYYTTQWDTISFFERWKAYWNKSRSSTLFDTFNYSTTGTSSTIETAYAKLRFSFPTVEDLKEPQSMSFPSFDGTNLIEVMLIPDSDGTYTFETKMHFELDVTVTSYTGADTVTGDWFLYLTHTDSGGTSKGSSPYEIDTDTRYGATPQTFMFVVNDTYTQTGLSVVDGDKFSFYLVTNAKRVSATDTMDSAFEFRIYHDSYVDFAYLTASEQVEVKYWLIHDVMERIIQILTGQANSLESSFLALTEHGAGTDGCGGLNMLTNGYQLRGKSNQLEVSLKECLDHVIAEYGCGWGFKNVYGSYSMVAELMEYFYRDTQIIDLGSPDEIKEGDSYKENSFDPLLVNNIKIGYSKYANDEDVDDNIQDFLTKAEYQTPVSSIEGSYSKISPFIASGRLIQATFNARLTPDKTWKYDENVFIVAGIRSAGSIVPENDEAFELITGIDDPSTAYNLRKAPVQMFLNHGLLINSACFGKTNDKLIQNVSSEINKAFTQKYVSYAKCVLGDRQLLTRSSTGNIAISDNFEGFRLFKPLQHEFTIAMSDETYNSIVRSMEGNNLDSTKDYGYLTYRDNEGNVQTGFPINIKRSPIQQIAKVVTLERSDSYSYTPPIVGDEGWNLSTALFLQDFSVVTQDGAIQGLTFNPTGSKMYIIGTDNDNVVEYDLSTNFNITTAVFLQNFSVNTQDATPNGVTFNNTGSKMYVLGRQNNKVYEYDLSINYDVSTSVFLQDFSVNTQDTAPFDLFFKPDGTKMYIAGVTNSKIYEYDLTAFNISTCVFNQDFSVATQDTSPAGVYFSTDGTKMYFVGQQNDKVYQYTLSSAFDISTASYLQEFSVSAQDIIPTGLFFKSNGFKMYVSGNNNDKVFEYDLTD